VERYGHDNGKTNIGKRPDFFSLIRLVFCKPAKAVIIAGNAH